MSSDTLAKASTAPDIPEHEDIPRIAPHRRPGQWTAAVAVLVLLFSVQLVHHRTCQVIPLLMVATVWYTVVTSLLGVGRHYVEKYYARGAGHTR